jgi:hypothetical protein
MMASERITSAEVDHSGWRLRILGMSHAWVLNESHLIDQHNPSIQN